MQVPLLKEVPLPPFPICLGRGRWCKLCTPHLLLDPGQALWRQYRGSQTWRLEEKILVFVPLSPCWAIFKSLYSIALGTNNNNGHVSIAHKSFPKNCKNIFYSLSEKGRLLYYLLLPLSANTHKHTTSHSSQNTHICSLNPLPYFFYLKNCLKNKQITYWQ